MDLDNRQLFPGLPDLHLADCQVQVWQAWLDRPVEELDRYAALLSADEKRRAERFHFERGRNQFILSRGLLRRILGAYLDIEPARVEFSYGPHGKPAIYLGQVESNLEFNLSHSNGLGVFAFCRGKPVGIDVEYVHSKIDEDRFSAEFFSPLENSWIAAHTGAEKQAGFYKIWTCKEAFFKVSGEGLNLPINQVEVDLDDSRSPRLAAVGGSIEQAARWKLLSFEPTAGYQAALAVDGKDWQVALGWLSL